MAVGILVLRALGLGDLLTAVPALRALREAYGPVTIAAPPALEPLAALAGCALVPAAPLAALPPAAQGAELLVNLHGRGPQSHRVALAAAPRELLAFAHPDVPETAGMPSWEPQSGPTATGPRPAAPAMAPVTGPRFPRAAPAEHEVRRWCRLLTEAGIPADPSRLDLPRPLLLAPYQACAGATVIHPGAASGARRWPADRFAAIALAERRAGRRVLVTGGPGERALALRVAAGAGLEDRAVLAGRTELGALAAIVAHAGRVVCGDTGVAHLATAFGVPSVVLFGPTSPATWGPPPERGHHRVLWAGRTGDPHADVPHDGLLAIAPERVLEELFALPS